MADMMIPEGWKRKKVGELSLVKRGASPRPIQDPKWWGGDIGWVRISDVTSSQKYLLKTTQYLSKEGVEKSVQIPIGEVVLSICATIGRPIIIGLDACIHDGFVWFDKLKNTIDREFWYYFLASKESFLSSQRQSGTQGNLNTSIVAELECLLPPLPEQQKIATILTSVDTVIEKTRAQIDKLKHLKTGMMQQLLTQGIGHTEFKNTPVGQIPKSWEVKLLTEVSDNLDAKRIPIKSTDRNSMKGSYRYYGASGVIDYVNDYIFDGSYILVGEDGENVLSRNLPLAFIVTGKFWVNNHAHVLQARNNMDLIFLCEYLESIDYTNIASGSAQPKITQAALNNILVPVPSLEEQHKIAKILQSIDTKIMIANQKLVSVEQTKKALMQDLLTGKKRVQ